jgi:rRNA maturation endonuclease Nob1
MVALLKDKAKQPHRQIKEGLELSVEESSVRLSLHTGVRKMLVCPNCGEELDLDEIGEVCTNCGVQVPLGMEQEDRRLYDEEPEEE